MPEDVHTPSRRLAQAGQTRHGPDVWPNPATGQGRVFGGPMQDLLLSGSNAGVVPSVERVRFCAVSALGRSAR